MRRAGIAAAAVLCWSHAGVSAAQPDCAEVLQIGAWNIEWLGRPEQRHDVEQRASDLAAYIGGSEVSVLALEEISVTHRASGGTPRNRILDDTFAALGANGARWQYRLFEKRTGSRDPNDQWTGLAWNEKRVTLVGQPWKLPITVDATREDALRQGVGGADAGVLVLSRWPQAVKLSAGAGKSDFVLVPLHLKSNRGGDGTAAVRAYETELVLAALAQPGGDAQEKDVVLLGDVNTLDGNEPAVTGVRSAGYNDCNVRGLATYIKSNEGAPFDRIFLARTQPETSASCPAQGNGSQPLDFKVVRQGVWRQGATRAQFVSKLSDHLMIRAGVCIRPDDD